MTSSSFQKTKMISSHCYFILVLFAVIVVVASAFRSTASSWSIIRHSASSNIPTSSCTPSNCRFASRQGHSMIMMSDPVKLVIVKPTAHDIYTGTDTYLLFPDFSWWPGKDTILRRLVLSILTSLLYHNLTPT